MAGFALLACACLFSVLVIGVAPGAFGEGCDDKLAAPQCSDWVEDSAEALRAACAVTTQSSACAVLDGCGAQGASPVCGSLGLFASLCAEYPEVEGCSRLSSECGEPSEIVECTAVSTLVSTDEAYQAVRRICDDHFMDACEMCKPLSDVATAVAPNEVQSMCPSPLGSLSELCLVMDMGPCSGWKMWCSEAKRGNYTHMCSKEFLKNESAKMTHGQQAAMTQSMQDHGSSDHTGMTMSAMDNGHTGQAANPNQSPCYIDPSNSTCVDFRQADTVTLQDLVGMCTAKGSGMPWMIGCSFWSDCKDMGSQDGYCDHFTLLATLCVDMPMMASCQNYNNLCASGSVVRQCKDHPPIPNALKTNATQGSVIDACLDHSMPACIQCPRKGAACADPMQTTSDLCMRMPNMEMCRDFHHFCSSTNNYFESLCIPKNNDYLPPMRMYFHLGTFEVVLFKGWVTRSNGEFAASFMAIVLLAIVAQGLKAQRVILENRWRKAILRKHPHHQDEYYPPASGVNDEAAYRPLTRRLKGHRYMNSSQAQRNLVRSIFTALIATLDYGLMLIAMIFNVYLFFAVIIGFAIGSLFLGHLGEPAVTTDPNAKCECSKGDDCKNGQCDSGFTVLNETCCGADI